MHKPLLQGRRRARLRWAAIVAAALLSTLSAGGALAAGLLISPSRLTVFQTSSQVPWNTCTLAEPVADATVDGALLNNNRNFGTQATTDVRSDSAGNHRAFVRFDLSSCAIPETATIQSAAMQLFLQGAPSTSRTYQVHRVAAAWGETTLTWSSQPAVSATATGTVPSGIQSGTTLQWNVVADVETFVARTATNNGWRLSDTAENAISPEQGTFGSREIGVASQRPRLVIKYRP